MRLKGRVDANQKEIVEILRQLGATVFILSSIGKGLPDLLVGFRGKNFLFEIKDGSKPKSQKKLTKAQEVFFDVWKGIVFKAENADEIIKILMEKNHA